MSENSDFSKITLEEALDWVDKNCFELSVRRRLKSRSVAFVLGTQLRIALDHIDDLNHKTSKTTGKDNV
jgi:hypothetical protein